MPTLDWWTGASYLSLRVITIAWWITSGNHPSPVHCLRVFSYWSLLLLVCCYCCHFVATAAIILPCYWYFAADTKSFRCGWIENSPTNTWEYSLDSPCVESTNLGWILYPRKLPRSHALVGYCKTISNCWAIGSSSLLTPLPWRHQVGNSCTSTTFFWSHCQGTAIIIFLAPLSGRGLLYSRSHLGFISADHYEESERPKNKSLALNYEGR